MKRDKDAIIHDEKDGRYVVLLNDFCHDVCSSCV